MLKKIASALLAVVLAALFTASGGAAGLTQAPTPASEREALFIKKMGVNYRTAPTPPLYAEGALYVASGEVMYRISAETGEELQRVKMAGRSMYTVVPPTAAAGMLFMPLDGGIVQAFDLKTLESRWIYRDPLGGQALCPVVCDTGRLFVGFWNGETEPANYVCLSAADGDPRRTDEEKTAVWTYEAPGGFYKAGAALISDWVIFGGEDGAAGSEGASRVTVLNRFSGRRAATLETRGDLRSETVYCEENGSFYIVSKAGLVYRFTCEPSTGKLTLRAVYEAPGGLTAAPVFWNGRLYTGCQSEGGGRLLVLEADSLRLLASAEMPGYPQVQMTLSTAYAETAGEAYLYSTYNRQPGGIVMFRLTPGDPAPEASALYTPPEECAQFCISPITVGADGTLYYKNDSGNVFAIRGEGEALAGVRGFFAGFRALLRRLTALMRGWKTLGNRV